MTKHKKFYMIEARDQDKQDISSNRGLKLIWKQNLMNF
jgi:hypothetical protein